MDRYRCWYCGNEADGDYCYICNHVLDTSDRIVDYDEEDDLDRDDYDERDFEEEDDYAVFGPAADSYLPSCAVESSVHPVKMRTRLGNNNASKELPHQSSGSDDGCAGVLFAKLIGGAFLLIGLVTIIVFPPVGAFFVLIGMALLEK